MRPLALRATLKRLHQIAAVRGIGVSVATGSKGSHQFIDFQDLETDAKLRVTISGNRTISPGIQRSIINYLSNRTRESDFAQRVSDLVIDVFSDSTAPSKELQNIDLVRNYVSGGSKDESESIFETSALLAEEFGFDFAAMDVKRGSWIQDIFLQVKSAFSSKEVQDRASVIEDVLFGHSTIDVDAKVVEMAVSLIASLSTSKSKSAVIDSGLFLFIKITDETGSPQVFAKRLTVSDRMTLNDDPTIVQQPHEVLEKLRDARQIRKERLAALEIAAAGRRAPDEREATSTVPPP